jgi:hypothetical protein
MPDTELLLALALVGVYLLDSMQFLPIGELALLNRRGRLRQVSFGSSFELAGRRPYLPNPFTPFWPALRVQWTSGARDTLPPAVASSEMQAFMERLRPISRLAGLSGLPILLVAPVALAVHGETLFIVSAAVSFALALAACCALAMRRTSVGLSASQAVSVSLVALICLPCAANMARAVAKLRVWTLAVSDLPALGFGGSEADQVRQRVAAFLGQILRLFPAGTPEHGALLSQMSLLERPPT